MGRLLTLLATLLLTAAGEVAAADRNDFDLSLEVRAVAYTGDQQSFLHGGGGKLRFDDQHEGWQLGSLRLGYRGDITDALRLTAEAFAYGDKHNTAIDLTELHLTWRPIPVSLNRHELKAGAFYAPISLEHRMRGWRTPYTLTPAAINSWVGEELRTVGVEYNYDWLGQQAGHALNVGLAGAVFGYNDPAGVVIALRGWGLHDHQTALFSRLGDPGSGIIAARRLVYPDIDHRAGYYAGGSANYRGRLELRALHYDNRGNPARMAPQINDGAWKTHFNSFGARYTPNGSWTFMWQRLNGRTYIGAQTPPNCWRFDSDYWLASWLRGRERLSVRLDEFRMYQNVSYFGSNNFDDGHAATLAWSHEINERFTVLAEVLRVRSELGARAWIGAPVAATERQLQLALRLEL